MRINTRFTKALRHISLGSIFAVLVTGSVFAQSGSRNSVPSGSSGSGSGSFGGSGGSISSDGTITGSGGGASTATESRLRGYAELVRATGQSRNSTSQAAINFRTADSKAIQNRIAAARAKVEIRQAKIDADRIKAAYLRETRQLRAERLAILRARPKQAAPRLTAAEFNKQTGELQWPAAINQPIFAGQRQKVERVLKSPIRMPVDEDKELIAAVDSLKKAIGKNARTLGYKNFTSANSFARRLQNQIKHQGLEQTHMVAKM